MGACSAMPTDESRIMPDGMASVRDVDLSPLHAELKLRRENSSRRINQTKIGEQLGLSSAQVSRLESGSRSLHNLTGSQLYTFLRGYLYTPSEIQGIVTRYQLNMPPQLLEEMAVASGMVTVMDEGGVSRPTSPTPVAIPAAWLDGREPTTVTIRRVQRGDLATPAAARVAKVGSVLTLSRDEEPEVGSPVIVRTSIGEALATWPLEREWATPYDPLAGAPALVSPAAEVVAVVISSTTTFPVKSGA